MGTMPRDSARELSRKGAAIVGIVEPNVVDHDSLLPEFLRKVPHRGENECNFLLMVADIARLGLDLGHEYDVARRQAVQRRNGAGELVA